MLYSLAAVVVSLGFVFAASLVVERLLGRSRKELRKPGWFFVFYAVFIPAGAMVYQLVAVDHPLLYASYALAGGLAALIAQCFFGVKVSPPSGGSSDA